MEHCIFCKIVEGKAPCFKVFEDEKFLAFLDINPLNPGHTLVIPKKHFRWVWDVPEVGEYFEFARKVALGIKKAMDTDWVIGLIIGEEVPHAHIWLVPRFAGDGHKGAIDLSFVRKISSKEMQEIAKKIQKAIT
jgi:histidine triad (HIT) family protein